MQRRPNSGKFLSHEQDSYFESWPSASLALPLMAAAAEKKAAQNPDAAAATTPANKNADLIDINTASEAELDALPGIGAAYAKKDCGRPPI